jgi:Kef-type K+ transport system membrane component KefB
MHTDPLAPVLLALFLILSSAKIGGEIAERLKQPSVLGELLIGVLIGNLGLLVPGWTILEPLRTGALNEGWATTVDNIARLGVVILLFEVGLESTLADMAKVGVSSVLVAVAGIVAPFLLGFGVSSILVPEIPASLAGIIPPGVHVVNIHLFVGATLCATSVGITARVFKDLGKLRTNEARVILGAAVIDDVLGLIILAIVVGMVESAASGAAIAPSDMISIGGKALGFLGAAIIIGRGIIPRILRPLSRFRTGGVIVTFALLLCFALSWIAQMAGLALIVGAFAAGLILEEVQFQGFAQKVSLYELIQPLTALFVPVFFFLMGARVRLETLADPAVVWMAAGLTFAAVIGKQICGLAAVGRGLDRLTIGIGMIPRGEVGLIFAGIGKELKILDEGLFSAIVIMVILTTLLTPPGLKFSLKRWEKSGNPGA